LTKKQLDYILGWVLNNKSIDKAILGEEIYGKITNDGREYPGITETPFQYFLLKEVWGLI